MPDFKKIAEAIIATKPATVADVLVIFKDNEVPVETEVVEDGPVEEEVVEEDTTNMDDTLMSSLEDMRGKAADKAMKGAKF